MAQELKFYNVVTRKSFTTTNYTIRRTKNGRKQAVGTDPKHGNKAYRFVADTFKA